MKRLLPLFAFLALGSTFAAAAVPEIAVPKEFVSAGSDSDRVIDHVRLLASEGKAKYRVRLGACDKGTVDVSAYLVPGYTEQIDAVTLNARDGSMFFAAKLSAGMPEFIFAQRVVGVSRDGKDVARPEDHRWKEQHFSMGQALVMLRSVAPNLFAAYVNELSNAQRAVLVKAKVLKQSDPSPLPSDCRLSDADKEPLEKWEKLPQ